MKLRKNTVSRVIRGGCYYYVSGSLIVSFRFWYGLEYRSRKGGFRFVVRRQK